MKKHCYTQKNVYRILPVIVAVLAVSCAYSCRDEDNVGREAGQNLSLDFTRAGEVQKVIVPNLRIFSFHPAGGANAGGYYREVVNLGRDAAAGTVTAQVEAGTWNLMLVAPPAGVPLIAPTGGITAGKMPMYTYAPAYNATLGKSEDAPRIYLANHNPVEITANTDRALATRMDPNMAKVQVVIEKSTSNFATASTEHELELANVPSTISYAGGLLPGKTAPTVLGSPLTAKIKLKKHATQAGHLCSDTVTFIIPAHRGDDYHRGTAAVDTTTLKMKVKVKLRRSGGSDFEETVTLSRVARCSSTLRVLITVNDGLLIKTEVLPWYGVEREAAVGAEYGNYLYVKKGSAGTGMSWSDAAPDILTAISRAKKLLAASKTVHGILVAGGSEYIYNETFFIPAGVRIFGGWEGKPGTELPAADANAPFTSTHRKLKTHKARISYNGGGTDYIALDSPHSLLDGFVISGSTGKWLLWANHADAAINAIEIIDNDFTDHLIAVTNGSTASNVLIAGNKRGNISCRSGARLINATIVDNAGDVHAPMAVVVNSVFWKNGSNNKPTNVLNSAFMGTLATTPAGAGNVHLNPDNTAWFSPTNDAPGPQFNLGSVSGRAGYMVNGSGRSPLLCRGRMLNFTTYATYFPAGYETDIDGNPRKWRTDPDLTTDIDIGCYEHGDGFDGFLMRWLSDKMYISSKGGYVNNLPLLIPNNENSNTAIEVAWTAKAVSGSAWSTYGGHTAVQGSNVVVGSLKFTNPGATPANDYTGATERLWGTIKISTNLGGYMPDAEIKILQVPGNSAEWTDGYAGSFHRNNERGARYIHGRNTGPWEVRILSGIEWIKIDTNAKDFGDNITDPAEGTPPGGGYYKEVKEAWGGYLSGTDNIKFRVGMKSKNTTGAPRYGLILITRQEVGITGAAMFFVRQGEDPDYLYRRGDAKPNGESRTTYLAKYSPYNVTDPQGRAQANGTLLTPGTSGFVKYPSQLGYYFRWNSRKAYLEGVAKGIGTGYGAWSRERDVCPAGYRHPSFMEYNSTIYYNAKVSNEKVSPNAADAKMNFQWGAYADGYYDQLAPDPIPVVNWVNTNPGYTDGKDYKLDDNRVNTGTATVANRGALMVNHYNYGSIFFPAGGYMDTDGQLSATYYRWLNYCVYPTDHSPKRNTHWTYDHIGMSCTDIDYRATTVRCVKK